VVAHGTIHVIDTRVPTQLESSSMLP